MIYIYAIVCNRATLLAVNAYACSLPRLTLSHPDLVAVCLVLLVVYSVLLRLL